MSLKHRIAAFSFLLVFLSAWIPSSVAHVVDPHHDHETSTTSDSFSESDHCPYCSIQLSAYTPSQTIIYNVSVEVNTLQPVIYLSSVSVEQPFSILSRGPPAI